MLKFILFLFVLYLVFRVVWRILKRLLFPGYNSRSPRSSFSSESQIKETEYEVIESHLKDNDRDVV
jgi:hypothetical protein